MNSLKFYFAWKVAEGASIMGGITNMKLISSYFDEGFGFEGYTPTGQVIGWKGIFYLIMFDFNSFIRGGEC